MLPYCRPPPPPRCTVVLKAFVLWILRPRLGVLWLSAKTRVQGLVCSLTLVPFASVVAILLGLVGCPAFEAVLDSFATCISLMIRLSP